MRVIAFVMLCWSMLGTPAFAQNVACGNGYYCPPNNACLQGGLCARYVDVVPGSLKMSNGKWCDPGFHEHTYKPGLCVPPGYADCANGSMCPPPNAVCKAGGGCEGGPSATGPTCKAGDAPCSEGRMCGSGGGCFNPQYAQDCGNGVLCSKFHACGLSGGCEIVAPERTQQFR